MRNVRNDAALQSMLTVKAITVLNDAYANLINNAEIGVCINKKNDQVYSMETNVDWSKIHCEDDIEEYRKYVNFFVVRIAARLLTGGTFEEDI